MSNLTFVTPRDWAEHRGVMKHRQLIISAAFGHKVLTLEQIKLSFFVVYLYELGSMSDASKAFNVTPSTLYRWRKSWE